MRNKTPSVHPVVTRKPGPRILLYSHDSFGLGNIRRTLLLATELAEGHPTAAILIVTGSPVIHAFRIPERVDYIKLPSLDRVAADRYEPRFLARWADDVREMRRSILARAVVDFSPDLFIVDKRPGGIDGELIGPLGELRSRGSRTRVVLGIRDILDAPHRTRPAIHRAGWMETIEEFYDEVWIYGSQSVFDSAREYDFSPAACERTHFTGYLAREPKPHMRSDGPPRALVSTGGGGDGSPMIEAYLEGLIRLPRAIALRSTVILGPEMPSQARAAILDRFGHLSDVEFCDFDTDPMFRLANADVVVAMAGYNTVCEILSSGPPALLVPRSKPVQEQLIRARRLSSKGLVHMVEPDELDPVELMDGVLSLVGERMDRTESIDLGGVDVVRSRARTLLAEASA